ncbi:hypothetical protein ACEQ8H_004134 [Pleosporales sp. CAS-2024a]
MRRSLRPLASTTGTGGSPGMTGSAKASLPPTTPRHHKPLTKNGATLDRLINDLEQEWQIGLKVRAPYWSPRHTPRTTADRIYGLVKQLLFTDGPLEAALDTFREKAPAYAHDKRLDLLLEILKIKAQSTPLRNGTPQRGPPETPESVQISRQSAGSRRLFDNYKSHAQNAAQTEAHHTALSDPDSLTDADDDDYQTPPSPTRSSEPARIREASRISFNSNPRKRRLDASASESSPKLTRTLQGKQLVDTMDIPQEAATLADSFKKPDSGVRCSSANTSFNDNFLFSSQGTQATSANTSFTTDGAGDEPSAVWHPKMSWMSLDSLAHIQDAVLSESECSTVKAKERREAARITFTSKVKAETDMGPRKRGSSTTSDGSAAETAPRPQAKLNTTSTSEDSRIGPPRLEPQDDASANRDEFSSPVAWYIRDIPSSNLFAKDLPDKFAACPYFLAFIATRIASANGVSIGDILECVDLLDARRDPDAFWKNVGGKFRTQSREPRQLWTAAKKSFEGYTFKAKVVFEKSRSAPVFRLESLPIQAETSCLFQRMFGSDRFLYLTFPSFQDQDKPGRFTKGQMPLVLEQWKLWIHRTHSFLGRTWRVFVIELLKKKGSSRWAKNESPDRRVILFATHGTGIKHPMCVGEMINRFLNFSRNSEQNFCKAYIRVLLGLSRTIPTLIFKPSQIVRLQDTIADLTPEAQDFNDSSLDWSERCSKRPVMNDGCARISVGAAQLLWDSYCDATGSEEPLPSAFQGRVGGAKGMWMISAEPHTRDPFHLKVWIEITESQQKLVPALEDEDDKTYDPHRLSFNLLKHSSVKGSSDLHMSFIPILVDRGVGRDVIASLIISRLDDERKQLLEMLRDPVRLHNWVTKQGTSTPALGILAWRAALPLSLPEQVKLLLRAGFRPDQSPYLARTLKQFVKQRQICIEEKLRAPLGRTTFLLGLADPLGVLKPGEVHVQFSKPFCDEYGRNTYRNLHCEEVLIARQPACRRSDIQKLRAVSHPQLSHLVDVIVFSLKGEYPAAGKLQGGDYDGDTFWVCWEPDLTAPFKNAPAPLNDLDPQKYGIRKDTRKLNEVMNPSDLSTVDNLLKEALDFHMTPSLLGKATTLADKVAYQENRIHSEKLSALYDLHDLLVDGSKQGYTFDDGEFIRLTRRQLRCGNPRVPAYKQAMEETAKTRGGEGIDKPKSIKHNPNNIIDFLYFDVVKKHNAETGQVLASYLPKEEDDDTDLRAPYLQLQSEAGNDQILADELGALFAGFEKIVNDWNRSLLGDKSDLTPEKYNKLLDTCYTKYCSLTPTNISHPRIAPLVYPYLGPEHPTIWETIRASALYTKYPKKHSFVWHMAGRELVRLKAGTNPDTYNVVPAVFADLKTKPATTIKLEDDGDEGSEEEEFDSAMEQLAG